jgi:YHS domain-containing protein
MKALFFIATLSLLAGCAEQGNKKVEGKMPPTEKTSGIKVEAALLAQKTDPVCDMDVTKEQADTATYNGKLYGFCGTGCKEEFLKAPQDYLK